LAALALILLRIQVEGARMEKIEAEPIMRELIREWAHEAQVAYDPNSEEQQPSFVEFTHWLHRNGYSHHLDFHSLQGTLSDVEQWFDEELMKAWQK